MLRKTGFSRLFVVSLVLSVVFCLSAAIAQPPAPMAPEKAATAWELEAKTVARQLKLNDEKAAKLVEAYKAARASHQAAVQEKIGEGGGREAYVAVREITAAEQTKLEAAL